MRKLTLVLSDATANSVYLTATAIGILIQSLPSDTAYCIGIVLIVMMTGRLMQHKGSLVHAALLPGFKFGSRAYALRLPNAMTSFSPRAGPLVQARQ
jgi:hypothetical protein